MKKKEQEEKFVICKKCHTNNEEDANFCKKCGSRIKKKLDRESSYLSLSRIFKILSIVIAIDTVFLARPHLGTARWDNIIISYALLLVFSLICSSIFRILGLHSNWKDFFHKPKEFIDKQTIVEMEAIAAILLCTTILFGYSYSRLIWIKPGNNYVEHKIKKYVTRWNNVEYERLGDRKCQESIHLWKSEITMIPNCYEYTYHITFKDGESCNITYKTRYDRKRNEEVFSYCAKK